jgi:hypothetical protein
MPPESATPPQEEAASAATVGEACVHGKEMPFLTEDGVPLLEGYDEPEYLLEELQDSLRSSRYHSEVYQDAGEPLVWQEPTIHDLVLWEKQPDSVTTVPHAYRVPSIMHNIVSELQRYLATQTYELSAPELLEAPAIVLGMPPLQQAPARKSSVEDLMAETREIKASVAAIVQPREHTHSSILESRGGTEVPTAKGSEQAIELQVPMHEQVIEPQVPMHERTFEDLISETHEITDDLRRIKESVEALVEPHGQQASPDMGTGGGAPLASEGIPTCEGSEQLTEPLLPASAAAFATPSSEEEASEQVRPHDMDVPATPVAEQLTEPLVQQPELAEAETAEAGAKSPTLEAVLAEMPAIQHPGAPEIEAPPQVPRIEGPVPMQALEAPEEMLVIQAPDERPLVEAPPVEHGAIVCEESKDADKKSEASAAQEPFRRVPAWPSFCSLTSSEPDIEPEVEMFERAPDLVACAAPAHHVPAKLHRVVREVQAYLSWCRSSSKRHQGGTPSTPPSTPLQVSEAEGDEVSSTSQVSWQPAGERDMPLEQAGERDMPLEQAGERDMPLEQAGVGAGYQGLPPPDAANAAVVMPGQGLISCSHIHTWYSV